MVIIKPEGKSKYYIWDNKSQGHILKRRRECLEIWHRLMSHKPYVQGHEKGHENYLSQTPGYIQGVIHLHREIIIQQAQDYGREEYDAG